MEDIRPYADAAWSYREQGWRGVIPIGFKTRASAAGPRRKLAPPVGYTGWEGRDPSGADVQAWSDGPEGAFNIGLHLPFGVYVLDVDEYGEKPGSESVQMLQERAGTPLPATWTNTSKGQDGPSRHHFFRAVLPEGRMWLDHPAGHDGGIESLHVGHRYAIVWPSIHPSGDQYFWYDPEGQLYEGVPSVEEFAELPPEWVDLLTKDGLRLEGVAAGAEETIATIQLFRVGQPCDVVQRLLTEELERINEGKGALHVPGPVYRMVALGIEGHAGVGLALSMHRQAYVDARMKGRDESEGHAAADWFRQVSGAVGKKLRDSGNTVKMVCDCESAFPSEPPRGASSLLFDGISAGETPAGDDDETAAPATEQPVPDDVVAQMIAKMLRPDQLAALKPPRHLVRGLLTFGSEAWLIGAPGSKKSFVALDLAAHVAGGRMWQGRKVAQATAVIIAAEGAGGIGKRVDAWQRTYGAITPDRFYVLPMPVQVTDKVAWQTLGLACMRLGAELIVIDTQARVTVGLEENSATDMGKYVDGVRWIKSATGACVLTVHHTGRNGRDARGSSAIDGAQDTELKIEPGGSWEYVKLLTEKQKDIEPADPIRLKFKKVPLGTDDEGAPIDSLVLALHDEWESAEMNDEALARVARDQAEERDDQHVLLDPEPWTKVVFPNAKQELIRRILQAVAVSGEAGRSEAQVMKLVESRWYPKGQGGGAGQLEVTKTDSGWVKAWSTCITTAHDDEPILINPIPSQKSKWAINPILLTLKPE